MEVLFADVLGYCMGVRRAVELAEHALDEHRDTNVYTLGPLIHNKTALSVLAEKGLKVLDENGTERVEKGCVVVIRAHGVPPSVSEKIEENGCVLVNATCPRVTASQRTAAEFSQKGYIVILAGDSNHGEVTGIAGYAGAGFILLQNSADARQLSLSKQTKAVLLSQTTFSPAEFEAISLILKEKCPQIEVINTICPATRQRQAALEKLCPLVDGVLVVGGRNSANTKRLLLTAQKRCRYAELIESADEIPHIFFSMNKVGITAGASTPDQVIQNVAERLKTSI